MGLWCSLVRVSQPTTLPLHLLHVKRSCRMPGPAEHWAFSAALPVMRCSSPRRCERPDQGGALPGDSALLVVPRKLDSSRGEEKLVARKCGTRVGDPLGSFRDGVEQALRAHGYSESRVDLLLLLMTHLSRWLAERGLDAGDLIRQEQAPGDIGKGDGRRNGRVLDSAGLIQLSPRRLAQSLLPGFTPSQRETSKLPPLST